MGYDIRSWGRTCRSPRSSSQAIFTTMRPPRSSFGIKRPNGCRPPRALAVANAMCVKHCCADPNADDDVPGEVDRPAHRGAELCSRCGSAWRLSRPWRVTTRSSEQAPEIHAAGAIGKHPIATAAGMGRLEVVREMVADDGTVRDACRCSTYRGCVLTTIPRRTSSWPPCGRGFTAIHKSKRISCIGESMRKRGTIGASPSAHNE
jgi:hypothetical protein